MLYARIVCSLFLLAALGLPTIKAEEYKLPDTLYFAGQRVPQEYLDVKERLYQVFYSMVYDKRGRAAHWLGKSGMFIPAIKKQLQEAGVHEDFAYVPVAESELNYRVASPAKASGLWQFIEPTAKRFFIRMDKQCDERNLLDKSTAAAGKYLFHLQNNVFNGDPFLALAAYNNGEGNVLKMLKAQQVSSFWQAVSNTETSDYVVRIIVYKELLSHPERYGLPVNNYNNYLTSTEYFTLNGLQKELNFGVVSRFLNISYRQFYLTNPHISHQGYNKGGFFSARTSLDILIPAGNGPALRDSLIAAGYLKIPELHGSESAATDSTIAEKESPASSTTAAAAKTPQAAENEQSREEKEPFVWHIVKEKSLGEIAFKYKTDWQKIAADNNLKIVQLDSGLKVAQIRKGQKLKIYRD